MLRDVVERFLRRAGFANFLGPALGVVALSKVMMWSSLCLATGNFSGPHGTRAGEPSTAGRPGCGIVSPASLLSLEVKAGPRDQLW